MKTMILIVGLMLLCTGLSYGKQNAKLVDGSDSAYMCSISKELYDTSDHSVESICSRYQEESPSDDEDNDPAPVPDRVLY
jgi:hypothetical protein